MVTTNPVVAFRIVRGHTYIYAATGMRYRVLNFSRCGRTQQEAVVYVGPIGSPHASWHHCTLADFAGRFVPEPEGAKVDSPSSVESSAPEKAVGAVEGSGF